MNGGAAASSSPKQTAKKPNGAKYLRQNEHSLFYDNLCLFIRRNGSIATQGRPDGVPAKDFLLQNYEELVKKRVYLIGSLLSLYLFCADGHDFLPVAKARLKDTRSNTDGDAMRALFLKSPMAEPYVRQAMEYYQRLIHVQNGQPNGNTVEDAVVRVLETVMPYDENDKVHGVVKGYYPNGKLKYTLPHRHGVYFGEAREYDENGRLRLVKRYDDKGERVYLREYP